MLRGRQAEAARNDDAIRAAARDVFLADPGAPVSAVAKAAGVGVAALYRRYPSKEDLLRTLAADGLGRYLAETAIAADDDDGDPWDVFAGWVHRVLEAETNGLAQRLAGTFEPTPELWVQAGRAHELTVRVVTRAHRAGVLRADVGVDDLTVLFELLAGLRLPDRDRTRDLRARYVALLLEALRAPGDAPLPGAPPTWEELRARWS